MDSLITEIFVVVVVQMLVSESACITAGTQVAEVVVVVGQVEVATIDVAEFIVVAD